MWLGITSSTMEAWRMTDSLAGGLMADTRSFDRLHALLLQTLQRLREVRTRPNRVFTLVDAALSAFAVFLMQAPSFLAYQRDMQRRMGQSNATSLFGVTRIPSDPQIRNLLDSVTPADVVPALWAVWAALQAGDYLTAYQGYLGATCGRWIARSTSVRRRFTVLTAARGRSTGRCITATAWWGRRWCARAIRAL